MYLSGVYFLFEALIFLLLTLQRRQWSRGLVSHGEFNCCWNPYSDVKEHWCWLREGLGNTRNCIWEVGISRHFSCDVVCHQSLRSYFSAVIKIILSSKGKKSMSPSCGLCSCMLWDRGYLMAAFSLNILYKSFNAKIHVRHQKANTKVILKGILCWYYYLYQPVTW